MGKRVLLVPDGMADDHLDALGGKTPLQAAHTPHMDALARAGVVGLVHTIPAGLPAGSDVANLSVLGYDPATVYTGRSPLEAANIGVDLAPEDVAYRCNFVTIRDGLMIDNTAGHIANDEARELIALLDERLGGGPFEFHYGLGYRHLMVWRGGEETTCTPPHDILDQAIIGHLPEGTVGNRLTAVMEAAHQVLAARRADTGIWLWGQGRAPHMPTFRELRGLSGAVVGAVDLVRGIGRYAGLEVLDVPGGTGDLDTDYASKARVACAALESYDFVFVHVEAPDEAGHMGLLDEKIRAIERIDAEVLGPLLTCPSAPALLVLPDHYTPVLLRTHVGTPVPFVFSGSADVSHHSATGFSEDGAQATGLALAGGAALMDLFLSSTA